LDLLLWLYYDVFEFPTFESKKFFLIEDCYYPKEVVDMVINRVLANRHKSEPVPLCTIRKTEASESCI